MANIYLIGEREHARIAGGGDTQVGHPVPYGCQSGAGQEREEGKGCQHHLGQLEGSLPPDEVEQTEESAYEEGVLEVPLLVGFPLQGHARLTSSTKISSEQKGRCFQQTINQCLEVTLSLTKKNIKTQFPSVWNGFSHQLMCSCRNEINQA